MWILLFALTGLSQAEDLPQSPRIETAQAWGCADVSCKALGSCEEACYKLQQCGQSKRGGDNDGIPCENLCSRPCD